MNDAVDAINNGFDGCRTFLGYGACGGRVVTTTVTTTIGVGQGHTVVIKTPESISMNPKAGISTALKLAATAYPNPYNDNVRFAIESNVSGHGVLEVYNLIGQKIQTVFDGNVFAGKSQLIQFNVPVQNRTTLMYRFRVGDKTVTGKLVRPN